MAMASELAVLRKDAKSERSTAVAAARAPSSRTPVIDAIRIENDSKVEDEVIRHYIRQRLGDPLNVERLQDDAARDKLREDIAEMAAMLNATLSYLRDEASAEAWQMMDVTALLESMVEDALDAGEDVTVAGHARPLLTRPVALRRCLSNLLQNALRYGHSARITISDTDALLR